MNISLFNILVLKLCSNKNGLMTKLYTARTQHVENCIYTVYQVLKYTKYHKYIPSTSTGQVLILFKKYLSTSSTFISSTSTSTSTHIKICAKVRMDIQSRINFGWTKQKGFPQIMSLLKSQNGHILCRVDFDGQNKGSFPKSCLCSKVEMTIFYAE